MSSVPHARSPIFPPPWVPPGGPPADRAPMPGLVWRQVSWSASCARATRQQFLEYLEASYFGIDAYIAAHSDGLFARLGRDMQAVRAFVQRLEPDRQYALVHAEL